MSGSTSPQPGATYTGQVHPTGMTVLYDPSCPIVDICFVHGFTGHPERTWQSKKRAMNSEPSFQKLSKRAKLGQFTISTSDRGGSAHAEPQSAVFWPRDLLPGVIPHSRVLTFGYDTNIRHSFNGPISQNRLSDHAKDFLAALQDCRRHHSRRPLIFVAHSLGGLLVKDTLRLSKSFDPIQPDAYDIYMSTSSLFFFGTPHAGADPRNTLHKIICNLTRILCFRVNEEIVQALMPGAERSKLLAEDFPKWTFDRDWNIFSFQEEFAHSALGVKIVEDDSSCVNDPRHERTVHIKADHVDMCRFTSCDDPEFNKVCAALRQALEKLPSGQRDCQLGATECHRHASPEASSSMLSSKQVDTILERLTFDGIDARYWTLRSPQRKTCQWLLNHPSYKSWVDSSKTRDHHGFFWIKGKPGTGKSISMKYLDLKARRSMKNRIVLRFFFNARGAELEHSTEGMYRSLLWQLLKALPSNSLDSYPLTQLYSLDGAASLPVETLKEAFSSVLANVPSHEIYCFVDALDECAEEEIRQMIGFFEEIGESTALGELNTRVCFSSRHYPYITIRRSLQLILEDENDHSKDIQEYIESQLKIDNNDRDSIKDEIFDLSSKIFLWVALVVDILNKENDRGGDVSVRGRLDQIPRGLHELFQDILTRDNESIEEMILCIQWILFAKRPLQPMELYFAIRIGSHPNSDTSLNCDMHIDHINRFNLNASKGLAEVTKKGATIQFIHESVRDYLLRDGGLDTLLRSQIPRMNWSEGSSHNTLRDICLKQIHAGNTARESADKESSGSDMPFLQYAFLGLDQVNFLTNFPTDVRHHSNQVDILYLLAEQNLASLIHVHPQRHRSFLVPDGKERFPNPLVTAMAFGNNEAVFALALEFTRERFAANRPQDFKQVEQELRTMPQRVLRLIRKSFLLTMLAESGIGVTRFSYTQ
ncbi:hypothetical protein F4777DRAFT_590802 [Nemania sp. FL0916]|nr:hypothetical protein F4777DRAFT_590802 [Nemania sp. FL0916]